jgi:hypothetical protein
MDRKLGMPALAVLLAVSVEKANFVKSLELVSVFCSTGCDFPTATRATPGITNEYERLLAGAVSGTAQMTNPCLLFDIEQAPSRAGG